jgi:cytochrome c biogenesis protein
LAGGGQVTDLRANPDAALPAQADEPQADEPQADEPQADEPQADEPQADEPQADQAAGLEDTAAPAPRPAGARLDLVGWLRWGWRQLTSMRTALILLFLLALGSVPGSLLPQEGINPAGVSQYYTSHPFLARVLGGLSLFNVFGAPWYAAVYLLLFISLVGCVLPRTWHMVTGVRQPPPRAPRRLGRLPFAVSYATALGPQQALDAAATMLSRKRFRVRTGPGWVAAEKGYLREAGNLLFHLALVGMLVSIGMGGLFGYKANRLLVEGTTFANTVTALDEFHPGRLVTPAGLQPFTVTLNRFRASYVTSGPLTGQPASFEASVSYTSAPQGQAHTFQLAVNHPLVVDGTRVFLIGHGYAPTFRITDGTGRVVFDGAVPFIPVETSGLTSEGAIKVPDAQPQQLGFAGVFLPTAVDASGVLESDFPAPDDPIVSLISYAGNLNMNSGPSQSVYSLDTAGLHRLALAPQPLAVGQSMKLPNGLGTLTYTGYKQWVSLAITYDPGQLPALVSGVVVLAGLLLSFMVRRRRVFVRASVGGSGQTMVDLGALTRSDAAGGFEDEFSGLAEELRGVHDAAPPGADAADRDLHSRPANDQADQDPAQPSSTSGE